MPRQKIRHNVTDVEKYCKRQKEVFGATKCEKIRERGDGKWDVLLEFPDAEL